MFHGFFGFQTMFIAIILHIDEDFNRIYQKDNKFGRIVRMRRHFYASFPAGFQQIS